ncbi:hypothetical protein Rs2_19398 [Raphanus sativus]|nr:hypothetical protein Rs2_19398 [Raphanus sativus]
MPLVATRLKWPVHLLKPSPDKATRVTWPSHWKIQLSIRRNTTGTRTTQRQRPSPPEPYPLQNTNQRDCNLNQIIPAKANVTNTGTTHQRRASIIKIRELIRGIASSYPEPLIVASMK